MDWYLRSHTHGPQHHSQMIQVDPNTHVRDVMAMRRGLLADRAPSGAVQDRSSNTFTQVNQRIRSRGFLEPLPEKAGKNAFFRDAMPMRSGQLSETVPLKPNPFTEVNRFSKPFPQMAGEHTDLNSLGSIEDIPQSPVPKTCREYIRDHGLHETPPQMAYSNAHVRDSIERNMPFFRATRKSKSIDDIPRNHFSKAKGQRMRDYDFYEKSKPMRALPRMSVEDSHAYDTGAHASDKETTKNNKDVEKILGDDTLDGISSIRDEIWETKISGSPMSDDIYDYASDYESAESYTGDDTLDDISSICDEIWESNISGAPYDQDETHASDKESTDSNKGVEKILGDDTIDGISSIRDEIWEWKISEPPMSRESIVNTSVEKSYAHDKVTTHASDKESTASNEDIEQIIGDNTMDGISSIRDEIWEWKISRAPMSHDIVDYASANESLKSNTVAAKVIKMDGYERIHVIYDEIRQNKADVSQSKQMIKQLQGPKKFKTRN